MKIIHGDCLEELKKLEDNSIDAVITDPPYGLFRGAKSHSEATNTLAEWAKGNWSYSPKIKQGYMESDWDKFVPPPELWAECLRVLKPGGHAAVFAGSRTVHIMGFALMLAGFEVRDNLSWVYGSGFARGQDLGKSLGEEWEGWSYALKPSHEPIILVRKPLVGGVRENVKQFGVGAINIAATRVANGRYPANTLFDTHMARELDEQSGESKTPDRITASSGGILMFHGCSSLEELEHLAKMGAKTPDGASAEKTLARYREKGGLKELECYGDEGGASRFFPVFKYQAKAPKRERPVIEREDGTKIQHSAVKPLALMEWLVTLVTPPNGIVLDPFAGSGTTLEAARNKNFHAIGIEQDADYIQLINKRMEGGEQSTRNS